MEQKTEASQAVDELLPCPFCASQPTLLVRAIACDSCLCDLGRSKGQSDTDLAMEWNRRAALKAQPAPTEAAQGEDSARLLVAVKAYRDLQRKIRAAGRPPHSDYWHQALYEAEAAIDAALASAESGGVKP